MNWLGQIALAIATALLAWLEQRQQRGQTASDVRTPKELRARWDAELRARLAGRPLPPRPQPGPSGDSFSGNRALIFWLAPLAAAVLSLCGCAAERAIFLDSNSDVVRLGPDVRGRVYIWSGGAWRLTGPVRLPEGWWAGPGPKD